jgi:hypothetical protein
MRKLFGRTPGGRGSEAPLINKTVQVGQFTVLCEALREYLSHAHACCKGGGAPRCIRAAAPALQGCNGKQRHAQHLILSARLRLQAGGCLFITLLRDIEVWLRLLAHLPPCTPPAPAAPVGSGGYADIYRTTELSSGARYALKHLRLGGEPALIAAVQAEAKAQARLRGHPNVLRLHAVAFAGPRGAESDGFFLLVRRECMVGAQ